MALFHKNVNELLANHVEDLEAVGLLTGDWYWDRQKILQLEKIDENLLKDLIQLCKNQASDTEKYQRLIREFLMLQRVLRKLLKEKISEPEERRYKAIVNRFVKEIEYSLLRDLPLRIGVIGWIFQKFDQRKASKILKKVFDSIDKKYNHRRKEVVSKLVDAGIPALAYRGAVRRGWKTVGIAPSIAKQYKCYPVDEEIIILDEWGEEDNKFIDLIDVLVRIGGLAHDRHYALMLETSDKEIYEVNLPAVLKEITIAQIPQIRHTASDLVTARKKLSQIVELPLLRACQILYDKNIRTTEAVANREMSVGKYAFIDIDYGLLSDENKRIAERFGQPRSVGTEKRIRIEMPIRDENVKVPDIEKRFVTIAKSFKNQKMNWAITLTYERATQYPYSTEKKSPQIIAKERDWIWDTDEQLFYVSGREHYEKVRKSRNLK